ncbi:MAG TPA: type I-E CRISPR-associated protein Cas5/CasD [Longimicrobiaceae bacterium]|nr:type I-E CRISPR-associated protein Cas5/CasD [Longimicrobiaceae bacterium]
MTEHLILRLDAPVQAWGDVAMDPRRPTRAFPSRSGLAGLLASALGWRYRDADRTTALQDALRYAVREDRSPDVMRDYQTADLGGIGKQGWTRWGAESRGGASAEGTQILEKFYLVDGAFTVALALREDSMSAAHAVALDDLERALRGPARPLFLGRRGCIPAAPLLPPPGGASRIVAETPLDALVQWPIAPADRQRLEAGITPHVRAWYDPADGTPRYHDASAEHSRRIETEEIWDRRDFRSNRFGGSRRIAQTLIPLSDFPNVHPEAAA